MPDRSRAGVRLHCVVGVVRVAGLAGVRHDC
jgi:hypothetical protein